MAIFGKAAGSLEILKTSDLRTCKVGDKIYGCVFIDLFPKEIQAFSRLFARALQSKIPWRISYMIKGGGMNKLTMKRMFSSILSFSSADNRLINDSVNLLEYLNVNTDDAICSYQVCLCTWAPNGKKALLENRVALLSRVVQGWGSCDVGEICGNPFEGFASTLPAFMQESASTTTVAPMSDILYMLPFYRPTSSWKEGALILRSPDGKVMPYQPGSPVQTTWIDLVFARPGSGKSVLSNAINLSLCLKPGLDRLPRIAVIDIGPSSSGLISLIKESLPVEKRHFVSYHRLRMTRDYSINPFDTQLGCRYPTPQERAFFS